MLARVLNAPLHFHFQKIWSRRFSISKDVFTTKEVFHNHRFFHDQEGFPQAKIFRWSRKFSTSKDFSFSWSRTFSPRKIFSLIREVFHKGSSIKYIPWRRGGVIKLKAHHLVWGEGERFSWKRTYAIIFCFACSLQNGNKIKKVSYSNSQNYPFLSLPCS